MAKFYFITALLLLQGCIYVCGSTSVSMSDSMSPSASTSPSVSATASQSSSQSMSTSVSQSTPPSVSTSTSPSVSTSVSQSTPPSMSQSTSPSVSSSVSQSTPPSVSQSTPPSVSQSTPPSVSQSTPPSVSQSTPPSVSQSTPPSVSQSTPPSVSQSTPPSVLQSTPPSVSQSTPPSVSQSTPPSVSQSTPPSVSQSTPPSVSQSTPPSVSQSTPPSVTPTPTSPPSTSIAPTTPPTIGAVVIIFLHIKVSSCAAGHNVTSSSEAMVLKANLTTNVKNVYKVEDKAEVYKVDLINSTCISSQKYVLVYINVTFVKGSIKAGVFIEEVLKAEISNNRLGDLPVSGTQYKVTFTGVNLDYKIKDGECKRVCCGAGGEVVLERTCSPSVRCEGIAVKTKNDAGHCPGESKATCKDVDCGDPDKACSSHTPSFALLLLLTVASFLKITAY